jgi:hypothetical protein
MRNTYRRKKRIHIRKSEKRKKRYVKCSSSISHNTKQKKKYQNKRKKKCSASIHHHNIKKKCSTSIHCDIKKESCDFDNYINHIVATNKNNNAIIPKSQFGIVSYEIPFNFSFVKTATYSIDSENSEFLSVADYNIQFQVVTSNNDTLMLMIFYNRNDISESILFKNFLNSDSFNLLPNFITYNVSYSFVLENVNNKLIDLSYGLNAQTGKRNIIILTPSYKIVFLQTTNINSMILEINKPDKLQVIYSPNFIKMIRDEDSNITYFQEVNGTSIICLIVPI